MSDLKNKDYTNLTKDDNKFVRISNISNDVILDNRPFNGEQPELISDYFDNKEFLILSKGENAVFKIVLEKDPYDYYDSYRHFDGNENFYKISVKNNNGIYETIYNFENESDYPLLNNLFDIKWQYKEDKYNVSIDFVPYTLVESLNKSYVIDINDIKIEIADKAGNIYTGYNTIPIYCFPFDLDELKKLEITFERQNPSDRYIGDNSIGSVVAIIHNPDNEGEKCSAESLKIDAYLADNSVGSIAPKGAVYFYYNVYGERVYVDDPEQITIIREETGYDIKRYEWLEVKIDNIVKTGYVQLYANLIYSNQYQEGISKDALNYIDKKIYESTLSFATDGEWLTECPNNKKINLEPFVPMYLKESQYFDFVKFTEDFLNTMFYSNDANCKVGILKKIEDLRNLHDIERIDRIFLNDFAKQYGSTIKINEENLVNLLTIFSDKNKESFDEEDLTNYIREAYRILPYYNKIKGTDESIKLILSTFGCSCEIIYKWLSKIDGYDELFENIEEGIDRDSYYLSSHFNVDLGIKNYLIEEYIDIVKPVKELIFSIKPVTRVFDAFEYALSVNDGIDLDFSNSIISFDKKNDECDIFDKFVDEDGKESDFFIIKVYVNSYQSDDGLYIYEIEFLDRLSRIGLDNLEKFVSNNGNNIIIDNKNVEFVDLMYCDSKLYIQATKNVPFDKSIHTITCKKFKNTNTYKNISRKI